MTYWVSSAVHTVISTTEIEPVITEYRNRNSTTGDQFMPHISDAKSTSHCENDETSTAVQCSVCRM